MKRTKKGFTLVELLVVIAIIAILAAIIAPNAFKAIEKSKVATAESDYRAIKTATLNYYSDTGAWPITGATDKGFVTKPDVSGTVTTEIVNAWNGPYLEKWKAKNPWGGTYSITTTGETVKLELTQVPENAAKKIDLDLDGSEGATVGQGSVSYATTYPTTVTILISQ